MTTTTVSPTCTVVGPNVEKAFNRRFQFVDGLGGNAAVKKTRSHVTREFYREQRYNDMHASGSKPAPFYRSSPVPKSKFVVQVLDFKETSQQNVSRLDQHHNESSNDELVSITPSGKGFKDPSQRTKGVLPHSSPVQTCLGSGRRDPFDSLPVRGTYEVAELVDYWYFVIPQFVHKQWRRFFSQPRPCRNLIYVYREDAATFLGLLHYAAQHMATSKGLRETKATLNYKYKTIQAVNKRIQSGIGSHDDVTVLAVTLLANAERIWGDRGVARMHGSALRRMIIERGGFVNFQHHRLLHAKLIWSLIALPVSQPFLFAPNAGSDEQCGDLDGHMPPAAIFSTFASFIESRRHAIEQLHLSTADPRSMHRFQAFQPGTRLNQAFAPVALSSLRSCETLDSKIRSPHQSSRATLDYMRMACLLYFNLIFGAYGDVSEKTEIFLSQFSPYDLETDEDFQLSAEHFLWSLVNLNLVRANARASSGNHQNFPQPHEMDVIDPAFRPDIRKENAIVWQLASMMDLLKIQSRVTWDRVEDTLRGFLHVDADVSAAKVGETLISDPLLGPACVMGDDMLGCCFSLE